MGKCTWDRARSGVPAGWLAQVLLSVCGLALGQGSEGRYLHEDAVVTARQMYSFTAGQETVNVLLGDFSLTVGRRVVSGRDAVLWVRERGSHRRTTRDIEVYVEGAARIVEPDGTVVSSPVILDVVRHRGALRARVGLHRGQGLESFPLYQRAAALRKKAAAEATAGGPPREGPRPPPTTTATAPATAPARRGHQPVSFRAGKVTSREVPDLTDPKAIRRITIARGNVYFSQGDPDEDLFTEIQADAAVVYSRPDADPKAPAPEKILGAYLEGDVVLRRGERSVRGTRLFYDFATGRAIILEPVLRTVQEQRNIPVYIRGREARQLAAREGPEGLRIRGYRWHFRDALVTSSDFYRPEYEIAAKRAWLEDTTLYEDGVRVSERGWRTRLEDTTLKLGSIPVLWVPRTVGDVEEGHTALRKLQMGKHGRFGWGVESEWFLFRLLGLERPKGFKGRLEADWYERGAMLGSTVRYTGRDHSGYGLAYGLWDSEEEDDFGTERKDLQARDTRGRLLWRHKQFLPRDWEVQLEASYLCDENFLEQFFPGEYWGGKAQENLLYAKKQRGDWAVTALAKFRLNDFLTQTEAFPDLGGYLVGKSLWGDRLTLYSEGHAGFVRYRPADPLDLPSSHSVARADTRHEIDWPLSLGPVKVVPFAVGRLTYWDGTPGDGGLLRRWGQVGANASMHVWRVYDDVDSRLWDLHRIKHVITPYGGVFASWTNAEPGRLYPFDPGIEGYVRRLRGGTVGVRQLWQTKRGPAGNRHTVDWLRLDLSACFYSNADTALPADGRYLFARPEYSLPRNAVNLDGAWSLSDSTTLLGQANYDTDSGKLGRGSLGVAVSRDPRLRYYAGVRHIGALDSTAGSFGLSYQISRKYTVNVFEQYDFNFRGGQNQATTATLIRKFARIYTAFTFVYDRTHGDVSVIFSLWPEGIPEVRIGGSRLSLLSATAAED